MLELSEELRLLDGMARDFALNELVEGREERDHYPFAPPSEDLLAKAREVGFFTIFLPEKMGGAAEPVQALCLVLEEVCREDASLGGAIFTVALAQELLRQAGSEKALMRAFAEAASLREAVPAFPSFHNPGDTAPLLVAERGGRGYRLTGSVEYVVLGNVAGKALLPAASAAGGWSLFTVDLEGEGVRVSEPVLSLGLHACPAVDLRLEGVPGTLVGEEGKGQLYFEAAADRLSAASAACSCGVMKGSFDAALEYARQRMQGGREIVNWSEVRMILSSMAVRAKAAEMLVRRAAAAVDGGDPGWELASRAAALLVQEMAVEVTCDGIQILGGNGYMQDYGQEKRFRDAQQLQALLGMVPMRRLRYIRRVVDGESPWS